MKMIAVVVGAILCCLVSGCGCSCSHDNSGDRDDGWANSLPPVINGGDKNSVLRS